MTLQHRIREKLQKAFHPTELEIIDQSADHLGHRENTADPGQETHFLIRLTSIAFNGKTLLEQHRMVYQILDTEFTQTSLHAVSLELKPFKA